LGIKDSWASFNNRWEDKFNLSKRFPDYFTKKVFNIAFVVVFLLIAILIFTDGLENHYYISCKDSHPCVNTLFACRGVPFGQSPMISGVDCLKATDEKLCVAGLCDTPYIEPGQTLGEQPSFLFRYCPLFMLLILALAVVVNHLIYAVKIQRRRTI
jgi:hypothetical protein